MAPQGVDNFTQNSSETTSLLGPSAHSSVPLETSYDGVPVEDEPRKTFNFSLKSGLTTELGVCLLLFGCAVAVIFASFPILRPETEESSDSPYYHPKPFSNQHPVTHLNLVDYIRSNETSPPDIFIEKDALTRPTNAWYQNMLMLRDEQPSDVHRAYASPYLLDVVGLIPGVRLHPNSILASTFVMQLNFNINHGLTVGAARDLKEGKKMGKQSHRYSIVSTTELGVTLKFVSCGRVITCFAIPEEIHCLC
jgi:hypothetical protein